MKPGKGLLFGCILMGFSGGALADLAALNDAAKRLCEKSKVCMQQEMAASEELPPGMAAMLDSMMGELCKQYMSIATMGENHEIIEPATACLNSMADKSCDDLLNGEETTTACQRYEHVAENYH
ncbi:MAG: hypothetical protein VYD53_16715 [Pseudomonadota bacterium]|nr:hypothetical protein [Pseudomonadota bacterium]